MLFFTQFVSDSYPYSLSPLHKWIPCTVAITQHLHLQEGLSPAHAQAQVCSPSLAAPGSSNIWAGCSGAMHACIPMQSKSQIQKSLPPTQCDAICLVTATLPKLAGNEVIWPLNTPCQLPGPARCSRSQAQLGTWQNSHPPPSLPHTV